MDFYLVIPAALNNNVNKTTQGWLACCKKFVMSIGSFAPAWLKFVEVLVWIGIIAGPDTVVFAFVLFMLMLKFKFYLYI